MFPDDLLYSQGFGTRRICAGLVQQGLVRFNTGAGLQMCDDTGVEIEAITGMVYQVQGVDWQYHEKAYFLLPNPAGTKGSHKPS